MRVIAYMMAPFAISIVGASGVGVAACAMSLVAVSAPARGQTLDLGGVPPGPAIGEVNGAADLAGVLETEAREIASQVDQLTGEARAVRAARAKVRSIAAYLLRGGSAKGWSESAPAVDGVRLAQLVGRIDGLFERAASGRNARGEELGLADSKRALVLIDAVGAVESDPLRRAMVAPANKLSVECARTLARALAPLVELCALMEGPQNDDPWPVLVDARSARPDRIAGLPSAGDVRARSMALPESALRDSLNAAIATVAARGAAGAVDLRLLALATDAFGLIDSIEGAGKPFAMAEPAMAAARSRILHAVESVARDDGSVSGGDGSAAADARATLEALDTTVSAAKALVALRRADGMTDAAKAAASDAIAALLAAEPPTASSLVEAERIRARTAARILDACAAAERLDASLVGNAPRDMRDLLRQFDRDARVAVRALPGAFKEMAADPASATDPGNLSAIDRVRSIEADRARIVALQGMIDSIAAIKPAAGRDFVAVAKRMARLLTDPLKRGEGQAAFAALEAQFGGSFPFAYEEELKRRTPRAVELTAGQPEKVIARAAAIRLEWCDAVGRGDLGGDASRRLDLAARLCRALRDLDQVIEPIDRAAGDRLATWGGWATRRAMIAPATQDLNARTLLTVRSFLAANDEAGRTTFERDLLVLESAIPLVRLTAALERRIGPVLRGDPDTVGAQLAPLIAVPAGNAYLASEWPRLLALHRAMVEAEFARRRGELKALEALNAYLAALAKEIEQSAFGAPKPVTRVPGFEGAPSKEPDDEKSRSRPGTRNRDR